MPVPVAELFANNPSTTVSAGGTGAPSSGTTETWTVASSAAFPAAAAGVSQFHVSDPALPSELILVTNVSGTTWTVTRGAESTAPVAHTTGFTVFQVISAGWLGGVANLAGAGFTGQASPAVAALTDAATIAVDASAGNHFRVTLGGNRTLGNPTNPTDGQKIVFEVIQPAAGGPCTLAYSSAYAFGAGVGTPVLTTTASKRDFIGFSYNATSAAWYCLAFAAGY